MVTGVSAGFAASNPSDGLLDLIYTLKAGYRQNGTFVMNRKTQAAVRKFKDTTGNYIWQPPAVAGGAASLLGFPLVEAEDMPDIGADSVSIAFGWPLPATFTPSLMRPSSGRRRSSWRMMMR